MIDLKKLEKDIDNLLENTTDEELRNWIDSKTKSIMWIKITDELPPEGIKVLTKINPNINVCELIRKGRLWFLSDMSMYVYYTPTHWLKTLII